MQKYLLIAFMLLPAFAWAHSEDYPPTAQAAMDLRAMTSPARDRIFACDAAAMGIPITRPWVGMDGMIDFTKKPQVPGDLRWDSVINIYNGAVSGNGLPSHITGEYPVKDKTVALYDRNPNSIQPQRLNFNLPQNPVIADVPSCLNKGTIGIMLTGAALFDALDAQNRDAVATEIFDKCEGHPERNGTYHYHHYSPCFDSGPKDGPSPLLGYALDGFGIYGPRGSKGHMITNAELDECHGTTSSVPDGTGGYKTAYHYVLNNEFPYSLGCYRGAPIAMHNGPPQGGQGVMRRPPDLRIVAVRLGISEQELRDALGPPPPDLNQAARTLGISVQQLRDALGPPPQ